MHVMSPVQQVNLKYGKDYILIEILQFIKKYDLNTVVLVVALFYSGQHALHYITITKYILENSSVSYTYMIS